MSFSVSNPTATNLHLSGRLGLLVQYVSHWALLRHECSRIIFHAQDRLCFSGGYSRRAA